MSESRSRSPSPTRPRPEAPGRLCAVAPVYTGRGYYSPRPRSGGERAGTTPSGAGSAYENPIVVSDSSDDEMPDYFAPSDDEDAPDGRTTPVLVAAGAYDDIIASAALGPPHFDINQLPTIPEGNDQASAQLWPASLDELSTVLNEFSTVPNK